MLAVVLKTEKKHDEVSQLDSKLNHFPCFKRFSHRSSLATDS